MLGVGFECAGLDHEEGQRMVADDAVAGASVCESCDEGF